MKQPPDATVFVVDDDPAVRRSLERLVRTVGLDVVTFPSAQEFLDHGPPEGPACLVLDVRMPGLSGLDLQKKLAETGFSVPVIFMTGHGTVPMSVRAMKAGAVDFLQKPFDEQALLDAVNQALEHDRATRRTEAQRLEARHIVLTHVSHHTRFPVGLPPNVTVAHDGWSPALAGQGILRDV